MKTFLIGFEQVNQTNIEVEARTLASAKRKARREWQEDYRPRITYMECQGRELPMMTESEL